MVVDAQQLAPRARMPALGGALRDADEQATQAPRQPPGIAARELARARHEGTEVLMDDLVLARNDRLVAARVPLAAAAPKETGATSLQAASALARTSQAEPASLRP